MNNQTTPITGWTQEDEANREKMMAECLNREASNVAEFFASNPPPCTGDYRDEDEYDMKINDSTGENACGDLFGTV